MPKSTAVRLDDDYKAALLAFDGQFTGSQVFGTTILSNTGYGGKTFTLDTFDDS